MTLLVVCFQNFESVPSLQLPSTPKAECSIQKMQEVLEEVTAKTKWNAVYIDCHLKLKKQDVVTKTLVFQGAEASGVTLDCNGATLKRTSINSPVRLRIESKRIVSNGKVSFSRPENVTLRACKIEGLAQVYGMSLNGQGFRQISSNEYDKTFHESAKSLGHTRRAQEAAPKNIKFEKINIVSNEGTPIYIGPGVTQFSLLQSTVSGEGEYAGIYLDAESGYNVIKDNWINYQSSKREQISIDGSAFNQIIGNRFSGIGHGGIFLYRNCGEPAIIDGKWMMGTSRHQTSSNNAILDNTFYYQSKTNLAPAVWIGSRTAQVKKIMADNKDNSLYKRFCLADKDNSYGSGKSDLDHAKDNVVAHNQIYNFASAKVVVSDGEANIITPNKTVDAASALERSEIKAHCHLPKAFPIEILASGYSVTHLRDENGIPTCTGQQYTCDNGQILQRPYNCQQAPRIVVSSFGCSSDNTGGCQGIVRCPDNHVVASVNAACNLESSMPEYIQRMAKATAAGAARIIIPSEKVEDGLCRIGTAQASQGYLSTRPLAGAQEFSYSCQEKRDQHSLGDCDIYGQVACIPKP